MGAKDQPRPARHFVDRLNEMDAAISEGADHVEVVDDFMENIDGRSISLQRPFYSLHRHLHTGAKPARFRKDHFFNGHSVEFKSGGISKGCQPRVIFRKDPGLWRFASRLVPGATPNLPIGR